MTRSIALTAALSTLLTASLLVVPAPVAAADPVLVGAGDIATAGRRRTRRRPPSSTPSRARSSRSATTRTPRAAPRSTGTATTRPGAGTSRARSRRPATTSTRPRGRRATSATSGQRRARRARATTATTSGRWHIDRAELELRRSSAAGRTPPRSRGCGRTSPPTRPITSSPTGITRASARASTATTTRSSPFWETLYAAGADIVLNGHDHDYERFAPQDPRGRADSAHGIREFVVGTGGRELRARDSTAANSQVFSDDLRRAQADAARELVRLAVRPDRRRVVHGHRHGHAARPGREIVQGDLGRLGGPAPSAREPWDLSAAVHRRRRRPRARPPQLRQVQASPASAGPSIGRCCACG